MKKGSRMTLESRMKMSIAHKGIVTWNKGIPIRPESRKKLSKAIKEKWQDPIYRGKLIKVHTGKKLSDDTRKKISLSLIGNKYNLGKKASEATRKKLSLIHKGRKHTEESRRKMSKIQKEIAKNPERLKKCLARRTPTSLEETFIKLFKELNLPYKYVGDGSFIIERKNPDFINMNGEKIAIEVFSTFYKNRKGQTVEKYIKERREIFAKYGWETVFFNESEANQETILKKLQTI